MAYSQNSGNPYQSGPAQESGYGNPNGSGPEQHELQQFGSGQSPYGDSKSAGVLSQQDFLQRVSYVRNEIRGLASDVQRISGLHQSALTGADNSAKRALDDLVASTQLKNASIRDQIKSLQGDVEQTTDGSASMKKRQFEALNSDFKKELQNYLQVEQQYRERYRDQIARQYRIVNPDASEEEVRNAADADWGNEGVFQMALLNNRSGQASTVLGNVRARHNELLQIEKSITELASLFQDLDTLIIQQDAIIERAEEQTEQTKQHLQEGNKQVEVGIKHARRARKMKWWCALVIFIICLAIGLGVGLGVYFNNKNN